MLMIMYGRGERSIAEQLGCTIQEAKALKEDVFNGFPAIKEFEQVSLEMARNKGYVTTLWGRKRRLPEIQLPEYEFYYQNGNRVPDGIARSYLYNLNKIRKFDERKNYIDSVAAKDGIIIKSNHSFIAQATRQVLNSRIQGSAADMSKKAMIKVDNDEALKEIGGKLVIPVHDELIIIVPLRYAREAKQLFAYDMEHAAEDRLKIPIKCDVTVSDRWYGEETDLETELKGLS